jgi:hypothetical protein
VQHFNLRRDGFMLGLLLVMVVLLVSALSGAYRVFGYTLVVFLSMLMGAGFVRRRDPVTWIPPLVASCVLFIGFAGLFANEGAAVSEAADTVLGFQPGTAFLVYVIWVPAFFTMGLSFALIFDRLAEYPDVHVPSGRGQA